MIVKLKRIKIWIINFVSQIIKKKRAIYWRKKKWWVVFMMMIINSSSNGSSISLKRTAAIPSNYPHQQQYKHPNQHHCHYYKWIDMSKWVNVGKKRVGHNFTKRSSLFYSRPVAMATVCICEWRTLENSIRTHQYWLSLPSTNTYPLLQHIPFAKLERHSELELPALAGWSVCKKGRWRVRFGQPVCVCVCTVKDRQVGLAW